MSNGSSVEERELVMPPAADTPQKRLEVACRAQEKLRYLHNVFSRWTHSGMTQKEYDDGVVDADNGVDELTVIPSKLKALYPFKNGMTVAKMEAYIKDEHKPRQNAISEQIGTNRAAFEDEMQKLTTWDDDIKVEDI